jgi:branched-chain amino acid transport system permease protein
VDVLVYGAILVLTMMYMPGGLAAGVERAARSIRGAVASRGRGERA